MKTLTILLAGFGVTWAVPASAACDAQTQAMAHEAHALAARLAEATSFYAPYGADWACAARHARAADLAAEAVIAGLACGDYCAAYDAAEGLHDLADDLHDDIDDLDFRPGRWRGPCRHTSAGLHSLAERLEDVSEDLRRATKRLDEGFYAGPVGGGGFCGTPVPTGLPRPYVVPGSVRVVPRTVEPSPYGVYEDSWPRRSTGDLGGTYGGSGFVVPPAGSFGTTPSVSPGNGVNPSYYGPEEGPGFGFGPSARMDSTSGYSKQVSLPPGQARKFDRRYGNAPRFASH